MRRPDWSVLLALVIGTVSAAWGGDDAPRPLKRSDVVFMCAGSPAAYKAYGATVVDWGGHAYADDEQAVAKFRAGVKTAQDAGAQYNAGIGMLTEFLGMIKSEPQHERAISRTIAGKPLIVPWLWDHKVDGELGKAWWFCSNSPFYQEYLRKLTARAMAGEPDGYHIDDFGGTTGTLWQGGCFCESCMKGFRNFLERNVPREKLAALGIEKLDDFDYGKFLLAKHAKDAEDFKKRRGAMPLDAEYRVFQAQAAGDVVRELQEYAAKQRGKALARSVNGAPPSLQALVVRPHIDHYSCEVWMGAPERPYSERDTGQKLTTSAAFTYKCGDMTRRGIAGTADGHSWAHVCAHNAVNLCRYWVAESYALGQCFMAPSEHQWCYTKEKGTHWLKNRPEDYADLYQFVRQHAELFDDYDTVAQAGVLFSHAAWRKNKQDAQTISRVLVEANVPFALLPAGDELLDLRLDAADLARCDRVIVPANPMLDPAQQQTLDQLAPAKRIVWKDAASLLAELKPWVAVEGGTKAWVLPRRRLNDPAAPLIVHVLSRAYDFAAEKTPLQENVWLRLQHALFGAHKPTRCQAFTPGAEPLMLPLESDDAGVRVKLPELKLWAVLRVD